MKKKWLIALVCCMYLIQIVFIVMCAASESSQYDKIFDVGMNLILIFSALTFVLVIANILCALKLYKEQLLPNPSKSAFGIAMTAKLVLVPFYILNFILWLIIAIFSLNPFLFFMGGWLLWVVIFLAIVFAYFTLLASSSYVIAQLFALRQRKAITLIECIVHIVLQLIFIADVVDIVYLHLKNIGKPATGQNAP